MTRVTIDQQLLQDTVDYLTKRPYEEVAILVEKITKDAKVYIEPVEKKAEPKTELPKQEKKA